MYPRSRTSGSTGGSITRRRRSTGSTRRAERGADSALSRLGADIHPYFAPDGASLLFNSTRGNGTLDLYALRLADGAIERLTDTLEEDSCGRYSPDMRQIVFLRNDATMDDVMLMDATTRRVTNLTRTPRVIDGWPVFSPDGAWIYYSTAETGAHSIHRIRPDGGGDQILTRAAAGEEDARASISGDGRRMIFNKRRAGGIDILALDLPAGR